MVNKFKTVCTECGDMVQPGEGKVVRMGKRWLGSHNDCKGKDSKYQSNLFVFSSGAEMYQNKRGRCEDAPCCGCCS